MTTANIKREPDAFSQYDDDNSEHNNQTLNNPENVQITNSVVLQEKIGELQSQLDKLMDGKDQQYKYFDEQLRNAKQQAEEWHKKYISAEGEIESLKKRINLLENKPTVKRSKRSIEVSTENAYYEVESILNHKEENGQMRYHIHWKNYNSTHDSWERESNLNCTSLLKRYKKANKLD